MTEKFVFDKLLIIIIDLEKEFIEFHKKKPNKQFLQYIYSCFTPVKYTNIYHRISQNVYLYTCTLHKY